MEVRNPPPRPASCLPPSTLFSAPPAPCGCLDTAITPLRNGTLPPKDMWPGPPGSVRRISWEPMLEAMREAARSAARHEVVLALEPEVNNVVDSVSKARRLLDEI